MATPEEIIQQAAESLNASADKADKASQQFYDVSNGDENTTVETDNGPVDTIAKAIREIKETLYNATLSSEIEQQTLSEGQTIIELNELTTNPRPIVYVEGSFEQDFTVIDETSLSLGSEYPEGTRVWFIQNMASELDIDKIQEAIDAGAAALEAAQRAENAANSIDPVFLLDRENHTGTQSSYTISDPENFTVSVSDGVPRTISSKWSDSLSVKDFGAVGDGLTDDTGALETANQYLNSLGGCMRFPAGTYLTRNGWTMGSNTTLVGDGMYVSTLKLHPDADPLTTVLRSTSYYGSPTMYEHTKNLCVSDMGFDADIRRVAAQIESAPLSIESIAPHATYNIVVPFPGMASGFTRLDARLADPRGDLSLRITGGEASGDDEVTVSVINTSDLTLTDISTSLSVASYDFSISGYSVGCAVGLMGVENVHLTRVRGTNALKHACDISARIYSKGSSADIDGYGDVPSRNIWVVDCEWSHGGDDNFTCHSVEYLWVVNNYSFDAFSTYVYNNNNAYEVDDASRHVNLINCRGVNCTSGIEIKGHSTSPAANGIIVENPRLDHNWGSAIDLHHTGYGDSGETESPTAYNVQIRGGLCRYNGGAWPGLRISGYHDVLVDGVTFLGDGNYNGFKVITAEDGARDVTIQNCRTRGFSNATGIWFMGSSTTRNIRWIGNNFQGGTARSGYVGSGVTQVSVLGNTFRTNPGDSVTGAAVLIFNNFSTVEMLLGDNQQTGFSRIASDYTGDLPGVSKGGTEVNGNWRYKMNSDGTIEAWCKSSNINLSSDYDVKTLPIPFTGISTVQITVDSDTDAWSDLTDRNKFIPNGRLRGLNSIDIVPLAIFGQTFNGAYGSVNITVTGYR